MGREIIIVEDGREVYRGKERRVEPGHFPLPSKLPFGLRPAEIINLLILLATAIAFVSSTYSMLKAHDRSIIRLTEFAENSDSWHTQVTGFMFKEGKPAGISLRVDKTRNLFKNDEATRTAN